MAKKKFKKADYKWEVRELPDGKWGIYLQQKFCRTDEPVCYAATVNKSSAERTVARMNDPDYWCEEV
tara:strand:+ start:1187 stop:1387 length:201 start_codon:yes stop_codon:yes gene_type:complete